MDFVECLIEYGLTRQEATIYTTLLKFGPMTGYEVSKETGISKSNVYAALKGLTQKGAAVCEEYEAVKYIPEDPKLFCDNHLRYLSELRENILKDQPRKAEIQEGYITIQGHRNIKSKIYEMLGRCEYRLYIMAKFKLVKDFEDVLGELSLEEKKVVVLSDEKPDIANITYYAAPIDDNQIRFVVDSRYVLTGICGDSDSDTCLYSGQENLVNLVKETIKSRMLLSGK